MPLWITDWVFHGKNKKKSENPVSTGFPHMFSGGKVEKSSEITAFR